MWTTLKTMSSSSALSDAGTDEVLVKIGLKRDPGFDVIKALKDRFRARIRVTPLLEICPADEIHKINFPAMSRKPIKFIDERKR
jgi:phenylacetate-CoA ligase